MPQPSACLDRRQFEDLFAGQLTVEEVEGLSAHLERCSRCAHAVETLGTGDTLDKAVRHARLASGLGPEAEVVAQLMKRLHDLGPADGGSPHEDYWAVGRNVVEEFLESAPGAETPSNADGRTQEWGDVLAPPRESSELGWLGAYRIVRVLGRGGMGVVFLAEDPQLQRLVALKVLKPALAVNQSSRLRFLREGRAMAAVKHDHIATIYQEGEVGRTPYLAMEFLRGESLESCLERVGRLPIQETLRIGREVACGLAAAHRRGLVHRDVKPSNIWLEAEPDEDRRPDDAVPSTTFGRVKILDFGLARAADDDGLLTQSGHVAGTPAYMAPEQVEGHAVDHRSDLFSLGCVLYRMCTGRMPFSGDNTTSRLWAILHHSPQPVREINPLVSESLERVICRLLEKDPPARFQSAKDVADALAAIEQEPTLAPQPTVPAAACGATPEPEARAAAGFLRRRSLRAATAIIAFAGLLGVGGIIYVTTDRGLLEIQTLTNDVRVLVEDEGRLVKVIDTKTGKQFELPSGEYRLRLGEEADGLELSARDVTLKRGGKAIVVVRAVSVPVVGTMKTTSPQTARPDNLFAPPFAVAPFDAAQAQNFQERWAEHLGVPVEITNSIGMPLRLIPPGDFRMGSTDAEIAAVLDEAKSAQHGSEYVEFTQKASGPQHFVRLTQPYYLGAHEVTVGQFRKFVEATNYRTLAERQGEAAHHWQKPSQDGGPDANHPALFMAWDDAQEFCRWLSRREGREYQLPSEAQWEFACRAGTQTLWSCGDDPALLPDDARFGQPSESGPDRVGQKRANPFGLHDLHGNADEWCLDWHIADFYRVTPAVDPVCGDKDRADAACRVVRGGWWNGPAGLVRSAARYYAFPNRAAPSNLGFRVALVGDLRPSPPASRVDTVPIAQSGVTHTIEIPANQPWVATGVKLEPGMELRIQASGQVETAIPADERDYYRHVPPAGREQRLDQFPEKHLPGLALLGRIGEGPAFLIGAEFQLLIQPSDGSGELFLGINDDVTTDNSGSWTANIRVATP